MSDFAKEVRELFSDAEAADKTNRDEALKDLEFAAGEHWDAQVKQYREELGVKKYGFPLPCLTINTIPQFIGQVIGDRRANATSIKVLPREDGDRQVAEVRSELIRSIELQSKADRVYTMAFDQLVTCGQGNFRIDLDYAYEDAFERDLFVRGIPNPMSVLWDPLAGDPTGRDAGHCFVADKITEAEYKRRFPKAKRVELFDSEAKTEGWASENTIRIAEYWRIEERPRTLAMMQDGRVEDVTDRDRNEWLPMVAQGANGPVIREKAMCKYAKMTLTNGEEELGEDFEVKLHRLPIIRCMGREVWIGDKRVRFGLVRFARDPARLKDYWRSVVAEMLMLAPRANWIATANAVKGREGDWTNTMVYNDNASAPPIPATQRDLGAMLNEAQMCAQDMKDTTGIHDASLGVKSNETSGVAIQRRQHEGDIATIVYHDNMNAAMQEAGEVLNALIPLVYDTARTIRTVGEDDAVKLVRVNDPMAEQPIDLGMGRYDVTVSTGPAYMTRRIEAATSMMEAARVAPQLFEVAGDLMAKAQDWPGADVIAERLKRAIPPQFLGADEKADEDPQAAAAAAQKAAEAEQMQKGAAMLEMRKTEAEAKKAEAEAERAEAEAEKAKMEVLEMRAGLTLKGAELAKSAVDNDDDVLGLPAQAEEPMGGVE